MTPLMWFRLAGVAVIVLLIYGGYQYIDYQGYKRGKAEIQAKYDKYKEDINDQIQKAKAHAEAEKKLQDTKYQAAKQSYSESQSRLDAALKRLRDAKIVSGNGPVQVAGCSCNPMPPETTDTCRTATIAEIEARVRETAFYADAIKDVLQCSRLIEFVR